jgi:hypothetical protein
MKSECENICKKMLMYIESGGRTETGFAIGRNYVYFRAGCLEDLETERAKRLGELDDATIKSPDSGSSTTVAKNVYIRSVKYGWVPAQLLEQDKDTAKVVMTHYEAEEFIVNNSGKGAIGFHSTIVNLNDYVGRALPVQNCGSGGTLKEVDNMVELPYLHEVSWIERVAPHYAQHILHWRRMGWFFDDDIFSFLLRVFSPVSSVDRGMRFANHVLRRIVSS